MEEFGFHMLLYRNRIVITGGTGRFASSLKKINTKYLIYYPSKTHLNILKEKSIFNYLKKKKPKYKGWVDSLQFTIGKWINYAYFYNFEKKLFEEFGYNSNSIDFCKENTGSKVS